MNMRPYQWDKTEDMQVLCHRRLTYKVGLTQLAHQHNWLQ